MDIKEEKKEDGEGETPTKQETDDGVEISEEPIEVDLTEDLYCGTNHEDIVQNFVCMICYGVVFKPVKCLQCETLYCSKCVQQNKKGYGEIPFDCLKNCGSKACTDKLHRLEKIIMGQLVFSCQNDECEEKIKYSNYFNHLENECKVLRYQSILLNGEELSQAQVERNIEKKAKQKAQDIGTLVAVEEKADWSYEKAWDTNQGAIRGLDGPGITTQAFTVEAAICCENAKGSRIISWRRYGGGFEWMGPNINTKKQRFFYARHSTRNIGKDLEIDKWYILALQWEPFEEEVEGVKKKKVRVRSFINHELDGEEIIETREWPNLEAGQKTCIGDTAYVNNEANCKFEGNIDYVKIWKKIDVGPYAPKPKEEEKKDEEKKEEEKKEEEVKQE